MVRGGSEMGVASFGDVQAHTSRGQPTWGIDDQQPPAPSGSLRGEHDHLE
jgi:hypothetical protein